MTFRRYATVQITEAEIAGPFADPTPSDMGPFTINLAPSKSSVLVYNMIGAATNTDGSSFGNWFRAKVGSDVNLSMIFVKTSASPLGGGEPTTTGYTEGYANFDWFAVYPASSSASINPNSQAGQWAIAIKEAYDAGRVQYPDTNVDDSYSLRDIVEFHPEIASVTMPQDYTWLNENSLSVTIGTFSFEPSSNWAFAFTDAGGSEVLVYDDSVFTSSGQITLTKIQHYVDDGFDIYTGDMVDPSSHDPFIHTTLNPRDADEVVQTWQETDDSGLIWKLQMIYKSENVETEEIEAEYEIQFMVEGSEDVEPPYNQIMNRWTFEGRNFSTQEAAESAWETTVSLKESQLAMRNVAIVEYQDEEKEGESIWTEEIEAGAYSPFAGQTLTYTLTYAGDGRYNLTRNTLSIGFIEGMTEEDAIGEAQELASSDANPEKEIYTIRTWRNYRDAITLWNEGKADLPDWCPFDILQIYGGHDFEDVNENSDEYSLALMNYDDLRTSAALRLRVRSGYAVGMNLLSENNDYFRDNIEGASGTEAYPTVPSTEPYDDVEISGDVLSDQEIDFILEGDNLLEIDIDSEWTNIWKFRLKTRGNDLAIDEPERFDNEVFVRINSVEQSSATNQGGNYDREEPEPNGNGDDETSTTDILQGVLVVGVGAALLVILIRATRERTSGGGE